MDINVEILGRPYTFKTKPGLFSKNEIDPGTLLLIETVEISPSDTVLDLGCGYGPIGIVAAGKAFKGKVYLVDADIRAVKHSEENVKLNNIRNAEVRISDGFDNLKDIEFDLVLSNPPSHMPKETLIEFIEGAFRQLKASGKFYFVTEKRIKPLIKREFERVFGNYEETAQKGVYVVSVARKLT